MKLKYLGVVLALGALAQTAVAVEKMRLGHGLPEDHAVHKAVVKFADLVKERSGGEIEIKVFANGVLGGEREMLEQVQNGVLEITKASASPLETFSTDYKVFNLPFVFRDRDHFFKVLTSPVGESILASSKKSGFIGLAYYDSGARSFYGKKPVNTPDDLKGLKIRVPEGNVFVETFNSYGASATPMSFGELYSALQLKTVDGQENPTTHVLTQKYYEVQKYLSITNHIHVAEPLLMSAKVYKTLPAEYQKALHEAGKEVAVWMMKEIGSQEAKEIEEIKKRGMLINTADVNAFKEASKKVYAKFEPVFGKDLIADITSGK